MRSPVLLWVWNSCSSHSLVSVSSNMSWLCFNKKDHWNRNMGNLKASFMAWQSVNVSFSSVAMSQGRTEIWLQNVIHFLSVFYTESVLRHSNLYSQEAWFASVSNCSSMKHCSCEWIDAFWVKCSPCLEEFRKTECWKMVVVWVSWMVVVE